MSSIKMTDRLMWGDLSHNNPMSVNYKGGKKSKKDKVITLNNQTTVVNKVKDDRKTVSEKRREKISELKRSREQLEMLKKNNNEDIKSKRIR